jgi:hypothetical protein
MMMVGLMCTIRVRSWWRFSGSLVREKVRCGDVRLQGEFNTGRFVELTFFLSSLPPFSFPAF